MLDVTCSATLSSFVTAAAINARCGENVCCELESPMPRFEGMVREKTSIQPEVRKYFA